MRRSPRHVVSRNARGQASNLCCRSSRPKPIPLVSVFFLRRDASLPSSLPPFRPSSPFHRILPLRSNTIFQSLVSHFPKPRLPLQSFVDPTTSYFPAIIASQSDVIRCLSLQPPRLLLLLLLRFFFLSPSPHGMVLLLHLPELCVPPSLPPGEKLLMASFLHHPSLIEHDDFVCVLNRAESE